MTRMDGLGMSADAGIASSAVRGGVAGGAFRSAFQDAQLRAAPAFAGGVSGAVRAAPSDAEREFMEFAGMSLQDKMLYSALASLGISSKFDAMSPAEKQEVLKKVALLMEQMTRAETEGRKSV